MKPRSAMSLVSAMPGAFFSFFPARATASFLVAQPGPKAMKLTSAREKAFIIGKAFIILSKHVNACVSISFFRKQKCNGETQPPIRPVVGFFGIVTVADLK